MSIAKNQMENAINLKIKNIKNKDEKNNSNFLFKNFLIYSFKNKFINCFFIILEYSIILLQTSACVGKVYSALLEKNGYGQFKSADKGININRSAYLYAISKISFLNPFKNFEDYAIKFDCIDFDNDSLNQNNKVCDLSYNTYILFYILISLFIFTYYLNHKSEKLNLKFLFKSPCRKKGLNVSNKGKNNFVIIENLKKIYVSFYDLFLHSFSIYMIYFNILVFLNSLSSLIYTNGKGTSMSLPINLLNLLSSLLFLIFFLIVSLRFIFEINIISELGQDRRLKINFHYDRYFSKKYDIFLLIMKILIGMENAIFFLNSKKLSLYPNIVVNNFLPSTINTYLNIITLSCLLLYSFNIILEVTVKKYTSNSTSTGIIYLINPTYNNVRIFLLFLNSLFVIFLLYAMKEIIDFSLGFIIFISLCIFVFSLVLTQIITDLNKKNIFNAEKFVYTFIHLYIYRHSPLQSVQSLLQHPNKFLEFGIYHNLHCINKYNNTCVVCNKGFKNFNFREIIEMGRKYVEILKNSTSEKEFTYMYTYNFNLDELEMLKMMKLIILEELEGDRRVKLVHKTKKQIYKDRSVRVSKRLFGNNFIYNLKFYYEYLLNRITNNTEKDSIGTGGLGISFNKGHSHLTEKSFVDLYTWFSLINSTCLLLESSSCKMLKLYEIFINKERREIFSFTQEINEYKENAMENLIYLFSENHKIQNCHPSFTSNYSLEILKYIYDRLFNPQLDLPILDAKNFEESCEYYNMCFDQEKLITISFNYNKRVLRLTRLNKELISFSGKNLEDLFPCQISKEGKELFIHKILNTSSHSNQFNFEFYMTKKNSDSASLSKDKYLNVFKMECLVCFSFDLSEFLIVAKYVIVKEDILMVNTDRNSGLVNFSEGVGHFLYLTVDVLDYMAKAGNFFYLDKIFKKSKTKMSFKHLKFNENEKNEKNPNMIYEFDLKEYYKVYIQNIRLVFKDYQEENLDDDVLRSLVNNFTRRIFDGGILEESFKSKEKSKNINSQASLAIISPQKLESQTRLLLKKLSSRKFYSPDCKPEALNSNKKLIQSYFNNLSPLKTLEKKNSEKENPFRHTKTSNQGGECFQSFYNFTLHIKDQIKNFTFYKIIEDIKTSTSRPKKIKETCFMSNETCLQNLNLQIENLIEENILTNNSSINSFSSGIQYSQSIPAIKNRLPYTTYQGNKNIFNTDEKNNKHLLTLTRYLIFTSFLIIIYCLAIMVIGILNNQKMNEILEIKRQFGVMQRYFYHTVTSSIGRVISQGKTRQNWEISIFEKKADDYFFDLNSKLSMDVQEFISDEILVKSDLFNSKLTEFKTTYYSSQFNTQIDAMMNKYQQYYTLSKIGNEINVIISSKGQNSMFMENLKVFMNNIREIQMNNDKNFVFIKIMNFRYNTPDFSNFEFSGLESLSRSQVLMLELFINYVSMQKGFSLVADLVENFYLKIIQGVFHLSLYLSYALIGIHIFLLFIGVKLVLHYKTILKHLSTMTNELITSNPSSFKYMKGKLESLRKMTFLFRESPIKMVNTLKKLKKEFVKSEKEKIRKRERQICKFRKFSEENNQNQEIGFRQCNDYDYLKSPKHIKSSNSKLTYFVDISNNLSPFIKIIVTMFIIYFIYSSICILHIFVYLNTTLITYEYTRASNLIFNNIVNNMNLLQISIFTNRTDQEIYYEMMDLGSSNFTNFLNFSENHTELITDQNQGYMLINNLNLMSHLNKIKNFRKFGIYIKSVFDFRNQTDCDSLYNLDDIIIKKVEKKYIDDNSNNLNSKSTNSVNNLNKGFNVNKSLSSLCKMYNLLSSPNPDITLIEESAIHALVNLLNKLEKANGDYLSLQNLSVEYDLYELYNIVVLVLRPYHSYINNNLMPVVEKNHLTNFLMFMIIYLCLNIVVDLIIMIVLYFYLIRKIEDANRKINNFVNIIKYM